MAIGGWKLSRRKRGRFIRRALSRTEASTIEIARRAGTGIAPGSVSDINIKEKIRPREMILQIAENARLETYNIRGTKRGSKRQRAKPAIFDEAQKKELLQRYKGAIAAIAAGWWKTEAVRLRFGGNWNEFLDSVNGFLFEQLDYFNPNATGKSGKPKQPLDWIRGGASLFCRRSFFEVIRGKVKEAAIMRGGEPIAARGWIPVSAKPFLKKLGLDLERIKDTGFWDVKAQIIKISQLPQTGLTRREKQVVELRLEDKSFIEIAQRFGLRVRSSIHPIEEKAAKKIKLQLEKL